MKKIKQVAKAVSLLGLVGCAVMGVHAFAAENTESSSEKDAFWYIGGNIGQSRAKIDNARISADLQKSGLSSSIVNDDRNTAFKLLGGYQYNKNFAVEAGYFDLGQFGYTANTLPAGTLNGKIKLKGLNLDAVGMLPIADKFSAFGRLGLNYAQARDNFSSTGAVAAPANANPGKNAINYKAGLGLQYDFTRSLAMRLEGERYRVDDGVGNKGDINMYSLGLVYRFNDKEPAPVKKETPPPAVVAAPIMIIVPVIVKTQKYCSILDIQFEIKQDDIQSVDKERLAVIGNYMKKYPDTTAVIEGHTDNVGASAYNMKLSQSRAESVVNYLVNELHIAASRLSAVGYGDTRPIADNGTMQGRQANRRIGAVIACVTDLADIKVAAARVTWAMEIEFDAYKATIDPQYFDGLREVAAFMKARPTVNATVEGHAGKFVGTGAQRERVSPELAMEISERRAQNVVNHLVDKLGVSRSRLSVAVFGQNRRVSYGTSLEGQQENRRVNIIFNYAK